MAVLKVASKGAWRVGRMVAPMVVRSADLMVFPKVEMKDVRLAAYLVVLTAVKMVDPTAV